MKYQITILLFLVVSFLCAGGNHHDGKFSFSASESGYCSLMEHLFIKVTDTCDTCIKINWGDGTFTTGTVNGEETYRHQFSTPGLYVIEVSGGDGCASWSVKVDSLLALSEALKKLKKDNKIWVMAHRSHTTDFSIPENSVAAVNAAIAAGADVIETDTHMTKDGCVVICHDKTVNATTDGKGNITKMTLTDIRKFNLKDRNGNVTEEKLPTLEEFLLAARGRIYVNLDYSPRTASTDEIMSIVEKLGMVQQVFLYCNKAEKIVEVLAYDPEAQVYCRCGLYPELLNAKYDYFFQAGWKPDTSKIGKDLPNARKAIEAGFLCSANMLHVNDKKIPESEVNDDFLKSLLECYPECRMIQNDCPELLIPKLEALGKRYENTQIIHPDYFLPDCGK